MNHGIHDHIMNLPVAYYVSVDATDTTKAVDLGTKASRMLEITLFEALPKVPTLVGATTILLTTYPPFVALIQFCVVVLSAIITKRKISVVNPRRDENIKSSQDLERIRQNGLRGWASAARHFRVRDEVTVYGDQLRDGGGVARARPHQFRARVGRLGEVASPGSSSANHDAARTRRRGLGIVNSNACTECRKKRAKRTMLYVSEYQAPHRLTAPHLRAGLHPMNIFADVVNRKTIPMAADLIARFEYHVERLTAAAITQTYNYMIEGGLEYGLLTTGEAIVFLRVDWQDPEALLYHLAEPSFQMADRSADERHACTAVGQYLAFSLMALRPAEEQSRPRPQDERDRVIARRREVGRLREIGPNGRRGTGRVTSRRQTRPGGRYQVHAAHRSGAPTLSSSLDAANSFWLGVGKASKGREARRASKASNTALTNVC
ncbi:hypothetical protein JX266_014047 [Neoarthrinium moseri]|nr:hypothetical protein JX266_014047 [Neoarthrinium moseri]